MKLEVGKKYVMRNNPDVIYVRIDAIRVELKGLNVICATGFEGDGGINSRRFHINGNWLTGGLEHDCDLVAEYSEPPKFEITINDVGRRVKHRNGNISIICLFDSSPTYAPGCRIYAGRAICDKYGKLFKDIDNEEDIIEFVK